LLAIADALNAENVPTRKAVAGPAALANRRGAVPARGDDVNWSMPADTREGHENVGRNTYKENNAGLTDYRRPRRDGPMAKAKPGSGQSDPVYGSKSAAIRALLTENPKMPVREVVAALAGRGIKVNPNLVYFVKGRMKTHLRRQQRRQAAPVGQRPREVNPVALVRKVKAMAAEVGGMKNLKQLVDLMAE
jgi:hypothetical protein